QRASLAGIAAPAQEEAHQLPHGIEAEAAGHDGVVLEVATEEPEVGTDVEFGDDPALALAAAVRGDLEDAVDHQHGVDGKSGVAGAEQLAVAAADQLLLGVGVLGFEYVGHRSLS